MRASERGARARGRLWAYRAALSLATIVASLGLLEVGGRIFLKLRPSYAVLYLEPDPRVGWKQVPRFHYRWTGLDPYLREFDVEVRINSLGFRDLERDEAKPEGTVRVALLGDSMVEAIQVPFEKTAGQLLERKLERRGGHCEVLNFGISNYSVGQYLLVWEAYVERFRPDSVFALVMPIQMDRSERAILRSRFGSQTLEVRPVFGVVDGALVRRPARDYERFVEVQREVLEREFGGRRLRPRSRSLLGWLWDRWRPRSQLRMPPTPPPSAPASSWRVNSLILEELARAVASAGARFAVVDASLPGPGGTSQKLEAFSQRVGIGYVPLYRTLVESWQSGRATSWRTDSHFNERGNELFADAMFEWLERENASSCWR